MRASPLVVLASAALALGACAKKSQTDNTSSTDTTVNSNDSTLNGSDAANDTSASVNSSNSALASSGQAQSPAQSFANTAAASDAFEIQSSQLAASNASSTAVKQFAKHMIEAHTASTAKLKSIVSSLSPAITPAATLSSDQQLKLTELQSKKGASFDSAYIDDQVAAHQMTLSALKQYSSAGDNTALKQFATQMIPIVAAHLNSAKGLKH